jgi:ribonuclease HI
MGFLLADDILKTSGDEKVEIIVDSLNVLDWVMNPCNSGGDPMLTAMRNLWQSRRVILSKVRGHIGNTGNDLADKWAKRARQETEPKTDAKSPILDPRTEIQITYRRKFEDESPLRKQ